MLNLVSIFSVSTLIVFLKLFQINCFRHRPITLDLHFKGCSYNICSKMFWSWYHMFNFKLDGSVHYLLHEILLLLICACKVRFSLVCLHCILLQNIHTQHNHYHHLFQKTVQSCPLHKSFSTYFWATSDS